MPANLTPVYMAAELKFKQAATLEEKLEALEEMFATIPKHKGTEKLQADIKKKISKTKEKLAQRPAKGKKGFSVHVDKEGAGQIAIVGLPNSGKSALVNALTNARSDVAPYPFTTRKPIAGMVHYEDIQIQLVDLPPVSDDYMEFWVPNLIRVADRLLIVLDIMAPDPLNDFEQLQRILATAKITLVGAPSLESITTSVARKTALICAAKIDLDPTAELVTILKEFISSEFTVIPVSVNQADSLTLMKELLFRSLQILRVYTKRPGEEPDLTQPYILPIGSTIVDVAKAVHKEVVSRLQYARIWGSTKFDGQRVQRDYILSDKDVVELHF